MASIIKRPGPHGRTVWQARVERKGWPRQFRTFDTKGAARRWAEAIEGEMARGAYVSRTEAESTTLGEALKRYQREVTEKKRGAAQERSIIGRLLESPIARTALGNVRSSDIASLIAAWTASGLAPATIHRRLALLSHLFETAARDWGIEGIGNPARRVQRPKVQNGRDRRLLPGEEARLLAACRRHGGVAYSTRFGRLFHDDSAGVSM